MCGQQAYPDPGAQTCLFFSVIEWRFPLVLPTQLPSILVSNPRAALLGTVHILQVVFLGGPNPGCVTTPPNGGRPTKNLAYLSLPSALVGVCSLFQFWKGEERSTRTLLCGIGSEGGWLGCEG